MKIEKKKISGEFKWSSATKAGLAALMGVAVSSIFPACNSENSSVNAPDDSQIQPKSSNANDTLGNTSSSCQSEANSPNSSSSSNQIQQNISSSESLAENPPNSSNANLNEPNSSQPAVSSGQVVVDIPKSSTSIDVDKILSSIAETPESSSSETPASSSSNVDNSSSSNPWNTRTPCNSFIEICDDPFNGEHGFSMVTTFESTDIDV